MRAQPTILFQVHARRDIEPAHRSRQNSTPPASFFGSTSVHSHTRPRPLPPRKLFGGAFQKRTVETCHPRIGFCRQNEDPCETKTGNSGGKETYLPLATGHCNVDESSGVCDPLLRAALGGLFLLLWFHLSRLMSASVWNLELCGFWAIGSRASESLRGRRRIGRGLMR